jgi:hypothetical protein
MSDPQSTVKVSKHVDSKGEMMNRKTKRQAIFKPRKQAVENHSKKNLQKQGWNHHCVDRFVKPWVI